MFKNIKWFVYFEALGSFTLFLGLLSFAIFSNVTSFKKLKALKYCDWIIIALFLLSIIATVVNIKRLNNGKKRCFNKSSVLVSDKENLKAFNTWFITISPLLIVDINSGINKLSVIIILIFMMKLLSTQRLYEYNLLYIMLGWNYYAVQTDGNEKRILISRCSSNQVYSHMKKNGKYLYLDDGRLYLPSRDIS